MSEDPLAKFEERNKAMRKARDEILRRVSSWLTEKGFARAGVGHFTRESGDLVCHIGFQKLSSGRNVRVMCHISHADASNGSISGPWSDAYACPNSPNGKKYQFGWSTRDADISRCAIEFCRYIDDVVIAWFEEQLAQSKKPKMALQLTRQSNGQSGFPICYGELRAIRSLEGGQLSFRVMRRGSLRRRR